MRLRKRSQLPQNRPARRQHRAGYPGDVKSGWRNWAVVAGVGVAALVAAVFLGRAIAGSNEPTSRADYQESVVTARDRVDFALGRLSKAQSLEELITRMDEAAVVIDKSAQELDDTTPPTDLEKQNTLLVAHLESLVTDVQGTADQLRVPGFEDILTGAEGLNFPSWDKINTVLGELQQLGIDVELLSRHTT
jgi:hypothetical protein